MFRFSFQLPLFGRPASRPARKPRKRARTKTREAGVSAPELLPIWCALVDRYFPGREDLKTYHVAWARRRQRRTLGSCNMTGKKVRIAKELNTPEYARWVEAVLYHELCHAVLGVVARSECGKRAWHGKDFRALEARHPDSAALDTWMKSGGWAHAVRSARSRAMWVKRKPGIASVR